MWHDNSSVVEASLHGNSRLHLELHLEHIITCEADAVPEEATNLSS